MIKEYPIRLSPRSRIHVRFSRRKKRILGFSVNFEIRYQKRWKTVIRYDTSHDRCKNKRLKGKPHKHTFYRNGKESITPINVRDYSSALTIAIMDIKNNFKKIKSRFFDYYEQE